jgi:hypothetical protein
MHISPNALAPRGSDLFVGGATLIAGGPGATAIAKWDGNSWSIPGSGVGAPTGYYPTVYTLTASGTNLYVAGDMSSAGGGAANYVAQWNGSSWSALGSGMGAMGGNTPRVLALAVSGTTLYAGGEFTTAGGINANYIAQWDGTNWSSLGSGVSSGRFNDTSVTALTASGGTLYVGGVFITAGSVGATNIAAWDGSSWSALGPGFNNAVNAVATSGNTLYAAGDFITSGGKFSPYMAMANVLAPPPTTSALLSGTNFILMWPANATGFTLQSTSNLVSLFWTTNSAAPVVVNGQNTVTNPISGTPQCFRLSQ